MADRRKYKKKVTSFVTAIQLDLGTEGFVHLKWDRRQACNRGDWLIDSNGDEYTVSPESYSRTSGQQLD